MATQTSLPLSVRACCAQLGVCAALLLAVACGASAPASPSAATGGSQGANAVVAGVVTWGQPGLSTAGLTAQVVGTNLTAAVGESGAFEIPGVPAGSIRLQFRSSTINATTGAVDVWADQFIQVRVQLTGTAAVIVEEARARKVSLCHAEGNGSYHLIDVSDDAEAAHRAHGDGKVGDPVPGQSGTVFDANCRPDGASVDIEKSTNGEDADSAPGPEILVGSPVTWRYVVTNTGTVNLTAVTVVDDKGVAVTCGGQTTLGPASSMTCTGAGVAALGQYSNLGTVTANWATGTRSGSVTDSDRSHYLGIAPAEVEGPKVTLCHRTGAGFYVQVSVSVSAEPAHRAHGDAGIGQSVPGQAGRVFTANCGVR